MGTIRVGEWTHFAVARQSGTVRTFRNGDLVASTSDGSANLNNTGNVLIATFGTNIDTHAYMSGIRMQVGTAQYTASFTCPTTPPTAITNTSLLLNFTNAGIFDSAMMNDLETVGNAQVSTSVVKYGTGSMAFDGSGDRFVFPFSPWLQMGSGDWTIECWIYFASAPGGGLYYGIYSNRAAVANYSPIAIFINSSRQIEAYFSTSGSSWTSSLTTSGVISTSTWTHIAIVRSGSTVKVYFNGTVDANTATISGALFTNTSQLLSVARQAAMI
jgi:uncharacterized protein (DUF427 family)